MSKILKYSLSVLIFSAFALSANAQNDESFLDFYRQRAQEFKDWRSKANSEFTDYLAAAWEEFLVQRGKEDPVGPVRMNRCITIPRRQNHPDCPVCHVPVL